MPLFLFDTDDGYVCVSDQIGVSLADRATAEKEAVSCLAGMAKDLSSDVQEVSVLVKSSNGTPVFRAALTLSCVSWAESAAEQRDMAPNRATFVFGDPSMIS
jgi:hypothetical protein